VRIIQRRLWHTEQRLYSSTFLDANTKITLCRKPPRFIKSISITPDIFDLSTANYLSQSRRAIIALLSL